ncbi:MAG: glucosyltransferase domain-containing protein [Lachnospiraceae bacterium]|nr:glucosyltransferase domain-containing protein [Lachnospiraceae bacterium]
MEGMNGKIRKGAGGLLTAPFLAFMSCFTAGIMTHLYALTNKIPNWDDVTDVNWYGMGEELGRWLIPHVWRMSTSYSAPAVHGLQAIALIAAAVAVCVSALRISDRTSAILTGISFAVFPALVSGMTYMFTVHVYALAILMSVSAAWITMRCRKTGWILGIALIFLSLSIYQAFYVFASGIFVISLAGDLMEGERAKDVVKKGVRYLVVLLLSMAFYLAFIKLAGFSLISYRGADSMGQISLSSIPMVIARSYHRFLQYFVTSPDSYIGPWTLAFMQVMTVTAFGIPVFFFFADRKRRDGRGVPETVLFLFCLFLVPLAVGGVYIMAPGVSKASTIMIYPYVLIFSLPGAVLRDRMLNVPELLKTLKPGPVEILKHKSPENTVVIRASKPGSTTPDTEIEITHFPKTLFYRWRGSSVKNRILVTMCCLFTASVILCSYQYSVVAGSAYFRSSIAMERLQGLYNRIMVRLEAQDGFQYGDKILICGDWWPEKNILSSYELDMDRFTDLDGVTAEHGLYTSGVRRQFIRTYLGIDYDLVMDEEGLAIEATREYKDMGVWPDSTCVKKINDIWIVKMHD